MFAHLQLLFPSGLFPSSLLTKLLKAFFKFIATADLVWKNYIVILWVITRYCSLVGGHQSCSGIRTMCFSVTLDPPTRPVAYPGIFFGGAGVQ